jgi:hypothetical protein
MFTGNRGCLVDEDRRLVRHHQGQLWIICVTSYKDWKSPLDRPRHWTPIFFLDDAVALAAGHRPCGLCRYRDYHVFRAAVQTGLGLSEPPSASELNRMLAGERLRRGGGLSRAGDRFVWSADIATIPDGTVIVGEDGDPKLVVGDSLYVFSFDGWESPSPRPGSGQVDVLTPRTSVIALGNGYSPVLHRSAYGG